MAAIKISQLPEITVINANTSNTILAGVDIPSGVTGKFTVHTLAQGMYLNEALNVGKNPNTLPNTVAQFAAAGASYVQTNLVNTDDGGSADIVITANTGSGGTDSTNFIDLGYANKNYQPGFEYNNIGTAINPLDGYLYIQGTKGSAGGNLAIGTVTSNTEIRFMVGGGTAANVALKMLANGLMLNTQSSLIFSDGTKQNTAAIGADFIGMVGYTANASYATANVALSTAAGAVANLNTITISNNLVVPGTINLQGSMTGSNGTFTNNLNVTNNMIVTGTANVYGTLNVVGIVSMNAQLVMANVNYTATESAVTIAASPTVATPANDGYMIHISGKNGIPSRIITDSYGTGAYSVYASRTARGTVDAPLPVQSGDIIGRFSANGYGNTKFQQYGTGRIDFIASENYTDANTGSQIKFWNCPVGTNTLTNILTLNGDSAEFTGVVNPQKGFIYTPTTYPGAQTAITVNFSNNSVIRTNTAAGLAVTLSNFVPGKVVKMWITNTAGTNQTFTHGCSALNSTVNATTYTIPGTSTIAVEYISFDSDLANTFVSIIHA
jgi:hypothetical protein